MPLIIHQQTANQLGGAGEEGLGVLLGGRGGYEYGVGR